MTCQSCVKSIQNAFKDVDGVLNVDIDLEGEKGTFEIDGSVNESDLVRRIEDCGFDTSVISNTSNDKQVDSRSVTISINGMTCQSCVKSIQNAFKNVDGILNVDIDLEGEKGTFEIDGSVNESDLVSRIEDCGFDASVISNTSNDKQVDSRSVTISIIGMTCQSCVKSIQNAFKDVDGVSNVDIDLEGEKGTFEIDGSVNELDLVRRIEDCGFDAQLCVPEADLLLSAIDNPNPFTKIPKSVKFNKDLESKAVFDPTKFPLIDLNNSRQTSPLPQPFADIPMVPLKKSALKSSLKQPDVNVEGDIVISKFEIHGMTCASCVATIEKHLSTIKGITNSSVSLGLERADISYSSKLLSDKDIAKIISDIGFQSKVIKENSTGVVDLSILGMTCASCSSTIHRHFKNKPGIHSVNINLLGQTGRFEIDKDLIGVRDLVEQIESLGFNAFIPSNTNNSQLESLARTREIKKWRRAFYKSLRLAIPVSIISMVLPPIIPKVVNYTLIFPGLTLGDFVMMILTIPIQFGIGNHFFKQSLKALKHNSYTMDVLITLGTSLAFGFSIISMIHSVFRGGQPPAQVFFETSSTLLTFVTFGRYIENRAKAKTSSALAELIQLAPTKANLLELDVKTNVLVGREIPSEYIKVGDLLKIMPGERIPCDGIIEFGSSNIDESLVTGEPLPLQKSCNDKVISGTVNGSGALHVRAERVGSDTTLSQIVKLVTGAQASKAPIQATADKVAGVFVPTVITLGLLTFFVWMVILCTTGWIPKSFPSDSNYVFVCLSMCISVIVVACPCALGLATPTAVMVGTGVGAKLGILIKGGEPLETAHRITKVVFDKTGTLTMGKMSVEIFDLFATCTYSKPRLMKLVGLVETLSEHPIGQSIVKYCDGPYEDAIITSNTVPGAGIFTTIKDHLSDSIITCCIGNLKFMNDNQCISSIDISAIQKHQESIGRTVVFIAIDSKIIGMIALSDTIKPEARAVIRCLKNMKIKTAMVTGDQLTTAEVIAQQCGITEVHAGITPAGKQSIIQSMQLTDVVAMVGDGVNDAASLAQSDMGIAVFGGTDVAVAAASIVLMRPDLKDVITAIDLSRVIFKRIWLNFFFASAYNLIMVPLAMGIGAPWGITLPAMVSGMAMSMSSVTVVVSSLLLQWYQRPTIYENGAMDANEDRTDPLMNELDRFLNEMDDDLSDPVIDDEEFDMLAFQGQTNVGSIGNSYRRLSTSLV
ncbi:hypothetical protein BC833DRAFT_597531 [Globomyces pollinis-pini]|nr:hypothetical protein BC833DRAFT_597531 [Globomyces pollinis-pini]